jgi:hypothetical protein
MGTETRTLPDACREHVDKINQALAAGDPDRAFYLAYQYFRARRKHIRGKRRQQDADGFSRQAAHLLAGFAGEMHRGRPADEFRLASPLIPGGDWRP